MVQDSNAGGGAMIVVRANISRLEGLSPTACYPKVPPLKPQFAAGTSVNVI
jgi:hypothetical protein